jgi:hypothetical protein
MADEHIQTHVCIAVTPHEVLAVSVHGPLRPFERDVFRFQLETKMRATTLPKTVRVEIEKTVEPDLEGTSPGRGLWRMAIRTVMLGIGQCSPNEYYVDGENYHSLLSSDEDTDQARLEVARLTLRYFKTRTGSLDELNLFHSTRYTVPAIDRAIRSLNREHGGGLFEFETATQFRLDGPLGALRRVLSELESEQTTLPETARRGETLEKKRTSKESGPKTFSDLLDETLFEDTRGYIRKVATQINGCYENGWYDACAAMVRRLLEVLIREVFEHKGVSDEIKDKDGNLLEFGKMISKLEQKSDWNLDKRTRQGLRKIKEIGDLSVHSRRVNLRKTDLDGHAQNLRVIAEELLNLASLKK